MSRRHRQPPPPTALIEPAPRVCVESAWLRSGPGRSTPKAIEVVKQDHKASVYRLIGCAPSGEEGNVIAKLSTRQGLLAERNVYETVLQRLPDGLAPRYHGGLDDGRSHWLFIQDVKGEPYSPHDPEQRRALGSYLAELHGAAAAVDGVRALPEQGIASVRRHLEEAHRRIAVGEREAVIDAGSRRLLGDLLKSLEILQEAWDAITEPCQGLAQTLVHGDLEPRNIRVIGGREAVAIDYEHAGCGVPALDLASAIGNDQGFGALPDLPTYAAVARRSWTGGLSDEEVRQLAELGTLLRLIISIRWASHHLSHAWPDKAVRRLRAYAPGLVWIVECLAQRSVIGGAFHG